MSSVRVKINPRATRELEKACMDALADAAEFIAQESANVAPIEEGTLVRSAQVSRDDATRTVAISYDTPYAVVQHEDTSLRHDQGRQAKYLEDPVLGFAPFAERYLAQRIRRATS